MKKLLALALFLSLGASAQNTTVSGTIVDTDGTVWANGSWQAQLINPNGGVVKYCASALPVTTQYSGSLNGSGAFSQVMADNTQVCPAGTLWQFTFASHTSAQASQISALVISGTTFNISSYATLNITAPRIKIGNLAGIYAYTDLEITNQSPGNMYWNVTSLATRQWTGSVWQNLTTSSWNGGTVFNPISVNSASSPGYNCTGTSSPCFQGNLTGNVTGPVITATSQVIAPNISYHSPTDYGAVPDGVIFYDGVMNSSSAVLTSATANFNCATLLATAKDIVVAGAGTSGSGAGSAISTTIASCQSTTQITLNTNALQNVTGAMFYFGTDNQAAVQSCVNAGGTCYGPAGKFLVVGNTASAINVNNSNTIVDDVNILFAPQGTITPGTNDRLFFSSATFGTCQQISSSISTAATSFTAASAPSGLTAGEWLVIFVEPVSGIISHVDFEQYSSNSSTTVNVLTPFRMNFPTPVTWNSSCVGTGYYPLTNVPKNITYQNLTYVIPNLGSANPIGGIMSQGTIGLTVQNVNCFNADSNCRSMNFDMNQKMLNDNFNESVQSEFTNSVNVIADSDQFFNVPGPLNQNSPPTNAGGPSFSYGTGFFKFTNSIIWNAYANATVVAYTGTHDGEISNISFGYNSKNISGGADFTGTGSYNLTFSNNKLTPGRAGTGTYGVQMTCSFTGSYTLCPSNNQVLDNIVPLRSGGNSDFDTDYALDETIPSNFLRYIDANNTQHSNLPILAGSATFGSTSSPVVNALSLLGSCTGVMQIPFLATTIEDAVGCVFSSGDVFVGANALQNTLNTDQWTQPYTTDGSSVLQTGYANGLNLYFVAAGTANGNHATFLSTPKFSVSNAGNVTYPGDTAFGSGTPAVIPSSSDLPQILNTPTVNGIPCYKSLGPPVVHGTCQTAPSGTPPICTCT